MEPPWSENAPAAERAGSITSTTRMPSPTVSAPAPPALRITMFVAPPAPTNVPSTTNVSERVAAPPSLSTVSSFSVPPLEMKVPGPATPACRAPVITSTSPATGLLCRSMMPELVNVDAYADQVALQRPAERHCVVGVAEREILPRAVQRGGACHCGEPQRSVVGEAVVWAGRRGPLWPPAAYRAAVPSGVGEVPQVEQAIVEDAVIAAGELHEAGDDAVVDMLVLLLGPDAGDSAIGQGADAAIIGQGRGAPGRTQDNAGGR